MKCENIFCLYNKNYQCLRKQIRIGSLAQCENCKLININTKEFNLEREQQYDSLIKNIDNNPILKTLDKL